MDLPKARLAWVELYTKTGDAGLVCRRCSISRPTLRKWWRRYQAVGEASLVEHSRRPHHLAAQKVFADQEALILSLRRERRHGAQPRSTAAQTQGRTPPRKCDVVCDVVHISLEPP